MAGRSYIREVTIIEGSFDDAFLYSRGINDAHGLRRNTEDKRLAVKSILDDHKWSGWSDNQIAKTCKVSQPFVGKVRKGTYNVISTNPVALLAATTIEPSKAILEAVVNESSSLSIHVDSDNSFLTGNSFSDNQMETNQNVTYNVISENQDIQPAKAIACQVTSEQTELKDLPVDVDSAAPTERTYTKNGQVKKMKTANIGKKSTRKPSKDSDDVEPPMSDEELHGDFDPVAELEAASKRIDELEAENELLRKAVEQDTQAQEIMRLTDALMQEEQEKFKWWHAEVEAKRQVSKQEWRCKQLTKELAEVKRQVSGEAAVSF
jgi:hypothetical protein